MCQGPDGAPQGLWQLYSRFQPIGPRDAATPTRVFGARRAGKNRLSRAQLRQDAAASKKVGGLGAAPGGNTLSSSRSWSVGAADVVTVAFVAVAPDGGRRCVAVGGGIACRIGYGQAARGGASRPAVPRVQAKLHVVGEGEGSGERRGIEKKKGWPFNTAVPKEFDELKGGISAAFLYCSLRAPLINEQVACGM